MTRENALRCTKRSGDAHITRIVRSSSNTPQTREDRRNGDGSQLWIIDCPKCQRQYMVTPEQIADRSWLKCPYCREAAE